MFDPFGPNGEILVSSGDAHVGYFHSAAVYDDELRDVMRTAEAAFFADMSERDPFLFKEYKAVEAAYADSPDDANIGEGYLGHMPVKLQEALVNQAKLRRTVETNRSAEIVYVIPDEVALRHFQRLCHDN